MGVLLTERHALPEGAWHFNRALDLGGRQFHVLINLARNQAAQGRLAEAKQLAIEAEGLDREVGKVATSILLSEIYEQTGEIEQAAPLIERVGPMLSASGYDISLTRAALDARTVNWRDGLERLDAQIDLAGHPRLLRGRLRERIGRYGEAWTDFEGGKKELARESGRHYDRAAVEQQYLALSRAFSAPFWQSVPAAGIRTDCPQPIFVFGFPRSGTTMTEQMLSSHSSIRAGGELPFAVQLCEFAQQLLGRGQPYPKGLGELAVADFHHVPALFRDFYLARAERWGLTANNASFFTDKMPLNEVHLPLLRLAFPKAPMILVRRHPLDILVSVMAHDLTHGMNCGYRIGDAAHQLAAAAQLAGYYRDALGLDYYEFGYERFVGDQRAETVRLMAYIGLEMEPAQLRFHENNRHAPTPSFDQVRQPVHNRSVGKWRRYQEQLSPVLAVVAQAAQDGGYAL